MNSTRSITASILAWALLSTIGCRDNGTIMIQTDHSAEQRTAKHFESIRNDRNELRAFLLDMPKGGDIHHHLTGAVYAETLIRLAVAQDLCVDSDTCELSSAPCEPDQRIPVVQAYSDGDLYNTLIDNWSLRNAQYFNSPPHDHFFAIFPEIAPAVGALGDILAVLQSRAATENVQYLETMVQVPPEQEAARALANELGWDDDLNRFYGNLMERGLADIAGRINTSLLHYCDRSREILQCGSAEADSGCYVPVRFQYYALRTLPREQVFTEMVLAFEVVTRSSPVVGVNVVGPEDDYTALSDYSTHMRMLEFLHGIYPDVRIDLHAGELTLNLVSVDDIRFHVNQAVQVAHADRIGHGVDISYETDSTWTLAEMARKRIAIEILLTSNEDLLGVRGEDHPFEVYLAAGVPVVLATDDPGILRTDLTEQFLLAASRYAVVDYTDLKAFVRNSIEFSFLDGESLWILPGDYTQVVSSCSWEAAGSEEPSPECGAFLETSAKATLQWRLEGDLARFEKGF